MPKIRPFTQENRFNLQDFQEAEID